MARQRNLHPDFFSDADLLECDPLARLLYAGMWGLADRRGVLEDKPLELKIKILPGDNCDIHMVLGQLIERGRVVRYEAEGKRCLWIPNLTKHQKFHPNEKPSRLPDPPGFPSESGNGARETPSKGLESGKGTAEGGSEGGSAARNIKPSESQAFMPSGSPESAASAAAPPSEPLELELQDPKRDPVAEVVGHYVEAMAANDVSVKDTESKRELVRKQLKAGWSVEQLNQAINGLTWSDFHMGRDPKTRGERYAGLEYAIGDSERIEANINRAQSPPTPPQRAGGWR